MALRATVRKGNEAPNACGGDVRRMWKPAFLFLGLWVGVSVPGAIAQSTDQIGVNFEGSPLQLFEPAR